MASDTRKAPKLQTVLRTPADQSESCRCSSALHTLLSFGFPAQPSGALQHEEIVDVELVDKIEQLSDAVGAPMAFFNLSVACSGPAAKPTISRYGRELL